MRVFLARLALPRLAIRPQGRPKSKPLSYAYNHHKRQNEPTPKLVRLIRNRSSQSDNLKICLECLKQNNNNPQKALNTLTTAFRMAGAGSPSESLKGMLLRVHNTRTEQEETFELYKKAANQGQAEAQFNLGLMYYHGENYNVAFKWFKKAANQGHVDAQFNVGLMCYDGKGIHKNYTKAFEWFKKAAEQGNHIAQYWLGKCYLHGIGTTKNYKIAIEWYKKSAKQGNDKPQYNLGLLYSNGEGTTENYKKASELWRNMERSPIVIYVTSA